MHASGDALDRVTELVGAYPAVRAATALRPGDKVERGAAERARGRADGGRRARLRTPAARLMPQANEIGSGPRRREVHTQFLSLSAAEVSALAADPAVVAIEPAGVPSFMTSGAPRSLPATLTGNAPSGPGYDAWLATNGFGAPFGFAIDVTDSGLDGGPPVVHPDLLGRVGYATDYTADPRRPRTAAATARTSPRSPRA